MIKSLIFLLVFMLGKGHSFQFEPPIALLDIWTGHPATIEGLELSPNGQRIASWDTNHTIYLWDTESGAVLATLDAHKTPIRRLIFSPDSQWMASYDDSDLILWNVEAATRTILQADGNYFWSVTFSPDAQLVAARDFDDNVKVWDVASGTLLIHLRNQSTYAFSPDSTLLAAATYQYEITVSNLRTGEEITRIDTDLRPVSGMAFTSDGTQLLSYGGFHMLLWDVFTGQLDTSFAANERLIFDFARFSPDETFIVSLHRDDHGSEMHVWETASGEELSDLTRFAGHIRSMFFSPDGSRFIAYDNGLYNERDHQSVIRAWEVGTWRLLSTMEGHTTWIDSLALNADNTRLLSASEDNTIRLWNMETGAEIAHLIAPSPRAVFAGSRIIGAAGKVITIYGVPDADHPALPYVFVPGEIIPSTINVRTAPSSDAEVIGYAFEGVTMVGAISPDGDFVYLPEYGGWARFDPQYVQVEQVDLLPVVD